jgi:hypothetical protein
MHIRGLLNYFKNCVQGFVIGLRVTYELENSKLITRNFVVFSHATTMSGAIK